MVMQVTVRWDVNAVINKLNAIQKGIGDRALVSALNKVTTQAQTQMSRAIREDYNISPALVRERLKIRRATAKGLATFTAALIGNPNSGGAKRSMNMIHFLERSVTLAEARRRGKSKTLSELRFKVKRSGGKVSIPGAFIGNNGRTVFIREGRARLPIKPVRTIGVPQMFSTRKNVGLVEKWIKANFHRILQSEIRYYLSRIK
jgi:Prophage minor tail protein Z (GPZ)